MGLTPQIMTPHRSLVWDWDQASGFWNASQMICYSARVENHCLNSKWTITFSLKPTPIYSTDFFTSHLTLHRTSASYEECLPTYLPPPSLHVPLSKNASRARVCSSKPRNSLRDTELPNQIDTFVSWSRLVPGLCDIYETLSLKCSLHSFSNFQGSLFLWWIYPFPPLFASWCDPRLLPWLSSHLYLFIISSPPRDANSDLVLQEPAAPWASLPCGFPETRAHGFFHQASSVPIKMPGIE